ncbi:hypothetical protein EHQ94_02155 [Leptospira meyeri]|nr:hypothetical protein EHQ94_02155 [Leptospira meyeri]
MTSANSDLTLRFGTYALARSATHSPLALLLLPQASFQSLTSLRDSGSGNVVKSSSLCVMP